MNSPNLCIFLGTQIVDHFNYQTEKMEQFRQVGEVLGSLKALMVLREDIRVNQRQCCLLLDIFRLAYKIIAEEIKENLRLEEKNTKWKALEQPLRELHRIFKEGELYIRNCLDYKDWFGKAISLHQNKDCIEYHIHNLLCCFPVVIEAIETAEEISGLDQDEMEKRRLVLSSKYEKEWNHPKLFQLKFGKQYMVSRDICHRLESVWREDRWLLLETIREKRGGRNITKHEQRLGDLMKKKLNGSGPFDGKLFPSSILIGAKDYLVRRRLGVANQYKEIQWMGESFAMRHFFGEIEPLNSEITSLLSLAHPNIMQYLCGFYDEEKKECFLVMELMNKDLGSHIKEVIGPRRRIPFSLPVAVDLMLQVARGMEYLHSQKIYHGDLNPSNILLKTRSSSPEGYFHAKVSGFGLINVQGNHSPRSIPVQNETHPYIWYSPEVLAEQDQPGSTGSNTKYSEKADVYSFAMFCFELLTGKVPFEDSHLQGDKMGRNIRAGERPLFPFPLPKYLVNLTRRCWQTDPNLRPSFSSICRVLRYIKRFLVMNPDPSQLELRLPNVDYCDIEAGFLKKFSGDQSMNLDLAPVSQIPFQMFAYRLLENERTSVNFKEKSWEAASEAGGAVSMCGDENASVSEDPFMQLSDRRSVVSLPISNRKPIPPSETTTEKKIATIRRSTSVKSLKSMSLKSPKSPGRLAKTNEESPKKQTKAPALSQKPSPLNPSRSMRVISERQLPALFSFPSPSRRKKPGLSSVSDSEIF